MKVWSYNIFSFIILYFLYLITPILALNPYGYEEQYHNLSKKMGYDSAILVIAYNRPHYFEQVVRALAATPEADYLPFIFVLDGGKNATQKEIVAIIARAAIKNKFIIARPKNYGCGRSILDARRFMFEWCDFKRIIVFEDDLVVNPEYITLTFNVHSWATKKYPTIGVVSSFYRCLLNERQKKKALNNVQEIADCFWGYCLDKNVYNSIKDILNEYELLHLQNSVGDTAYNIASWMEKVLYDKKNESLRGIFPSSTIPYIQEFENYIKHLKDLPNMRNEQDRQFRLALYKKGYIKINTVVNRALYIGGRSHKDDKIELHRFVEDSIIKEFQLTCLATN